MTHFAATEMAIFNEMQHTATGCDKRHNILCSVRHYLPEQLIQRAWFQALTAALCDAQNGRPCIIGQLIWKWFPEDTLIFTIGLHRGCFKRVF